YFSTPFIFLFPSFIVAQVLSQAQRSYMYITCFWIFCVASLPCVYPLSCPNLPWVGDSDGLVVRDGLQAGLGLGLGLVPSSILLPAKEGMRRGQGLHYDTQKHT
ncbi:unnamed protein product, partial [Discosporangium mesarthrocarpum]